MIALRSQADAPRNRYVTEDGVGSWSRYFRGREHRADPTAPDPEIGVLHAVAFAVEQDPETTLSAHFHAADQFQVFTAGSGRIGKHELRPLTIHYANAYTPYGPIVAGPHGVSYLTLRNGWDRGPRIMPAARNELLAAKGRRPRVVTAGPFEASEAVGAILAEAEPIETLIPRSEDGLWAEIRRAGPQGAILGPDPSGGRGAFWVVLAGSIAAAADASAAQSWAVFVGPQDAPLQLQAGATGLEILMLQFPQARQSTAIMENPA